MTLLRLLIVALLLWVGTQGPSWADQSSLRLAAGTTVENSGLSKPLLSRFEQETGIHVELIPIGTRQALKLAENGDVDVVLVHSKQDELAFIAAGYGVDRREVMYNDFIIIGPAADPAQIAGAESARAAMGRIAAHASPFISRGDGSGTNIKELDLWRAAALDPATFATSWYRAAGSGMGATLNIAAASDAYTISDRATWISFQNKAHLKILFSGDAMLNNQYAVIRVNPARNPHVNAQAALRFADWVTGAAGQQTIAAFRLEGQQLFFPNAKPGS